MAIPQNPNSLQALGQIGMARLPASSTPILLAGGPTPTPAAPTGPATPPVPEGASTGADGAIIPPERAPVAPPLSAPGPVMQTQGASNVAPWQMSGLGRRPHGTAHGMHGARGGGGGGGSLAPLHALTGAFGQGGY